MAASEQHTLWSDDRGDRHRIGAREMLRLAFPAVASVTAIARARCLAAICAKPVPLVPGKQRSRLRQKCKLVGFEQPLHGEAAQIDEPMPRRHFRFADRGFVREGYAADLVLFDAATVQDAATFEQPHAYAVGIPHVLVNGVLVVKDGVHTGAKPGVVLRSKPGAR